MSARHKRKKFNPPKYREGFGPKPETIFRGNAPDLKELFPGQTYSSFWDSPEALARDIGQVKRGDCWTHSAYDPARNGEFYGTPTMEHALHLAMKGWTEGANLIEETRRKIQALRPKGPRMIKYGIAGAYPNVPRAVAGNILNMHQPAIDKARKRAVITLVADMSANCGVDKQMITNRAATVAALIDEIEGAGFSCEVIACGTSKDTWGSKDPPKYTALTAVRIKESHQPMDVVRMAFPLGHAAMWRRLIFGDWQREPSARTGLGDCLGFTGAVPITPDMAERGIYVLPSAGTNTKLFKDEKIAASEGIAWLIQKLQEQGCPAFTDGKVVIEREEEDEEELDDDF